MAVEGDRGYRLPPPAITALVDAPTTPDLSIDPSNTYLLLMARTDLLPVAELARPELRIAGLRIDPAANGPSRTAFYTGLTFRRIADGSERPVSGLPDGARIGAVRWSPNGQQIAFPIRDGEGISLWVADLATAVARRLTEPRLNGVLGSTFAWMPDSRSLLCRMVPAERGAPPPAPTVPDGPIIQENCGKVAPSRTYQDLLKNTHDEALFDYYATAQLARVSLDGQVTPLGSAGIVRRVDPAPGGEYLLVETIHRPFSYLVPWYRFPYRVELWDPAGRPVRLLADLPLAEEVPIAFDAVPEGPRDYHWRADAPATLQWVEAQDGGDPRRETECRDHLYTLSAPFAAEPTLLAATRSRFSGFWAGDGKLALLRERWWKTRWERVWRLAPDEPDTPPQLLFDRSYEDRYSDPGSPLMRWTPTGSAVLLTADEGRTLFLVGDGASPEGDRPFLDRFDLETATAERLWRSEAPYYERPARLLDPDALQLLTCRESVAEPPNFFLRDLRAGEARRLTEFPHPTPQLLGIQKEVIRYQREDGVPLTATLYLPAGYKPEDGPLPVLMWAYPREYKNAAAAGQVNTSPYRFVRLSTGSPLYFLAHGYAVLDGPTMPIVGEGDREANDSYVEQLVASARAAVAELARRGVGDPKRMAIGGHSYGGFMTANLLAHSDLFAAGIARSGAYNRTLTPFGFQAEERTLWEAPEVYFGMSPFMHAHQIKAPLLLIHGEADNNSGTFPMQSERLYNALKGHGATTRLVLLPHESHGYQARESILHMLWEMAEWLDRYAKGTTERS